MAINYAQLAQQQANSMGVPNQNFNLGNTGNLTAYGPGTNGGIPSGGLGGFGSGAGGATIYDTLTPQQHQIADMLQGNIAKGANAYQGAINYGVGNAMTANPAGGLSPSATAKYIKDSVATPLLRQYDQSIMPRLNDSYAAVGALMGSRRGFANQQALQGLQGQIAQQLGNAQLQNMHQSAQLQSETANRQSQLAQGLMASQQGYNRLGAELTGQPWMAIQPNVGGFPGMFSTSQQNFGGFGGGGSSSQPFTGTPPGGYTSDSNAWGSNYDNKASLDLWNQTFGNVADSPDAHMEGWNDPAFSPDMTYTVGDENNGPSF